ncbi:MULTISPECIES: flavin-containing monooxygenase [Bradyrhizobium]|jgi:cation diffusion facilitator CzcD-associated flavoprotein CzcO|uniref:flavin-containing monooxygenase n=1 Tax=Bradyrhizobium TaxID=374 RepID=UPI0004845FEE|nr:MULTISPECIES: NAD(P)/FAD-dependent oxidoreductase [Bradyrhizobium]MCS3445956.1 putative flavoprotein involved in K+ transport [Bradyrhizobium elkanii]MCS3562912.1 putative flavoprotein involved in K+ transport [Bradyrhizobium elkanii]MCW2147252.1 putative flavoprotein involved in K+ transport [Bradyrhizobium elkanii]MCW2353670.1 putative flavoprotein involved in K+ transport [Bradyrhizobium elkanii]MCW2380083.1 putative flavoprotein involved in K+ transport [Bradyrhizobium elkanii]
MLDKTDDISVAADNWLVQFEDALASPDDVLLKPLFHPDSYWRDVLALSWNIQTVNRAFAIIEELPAHARHSAPHDFRIDADRAPPRRVTRAGTHAIEAIFKFETAVGRGHGIVRLIPDAADDDRLKAWTLLTALEELKGFEEQQGHTRPRGQAYSRDFRGPNWLDLRKASAEYADRDPDVLVVGGGQAGLAIAARLQQLKIDALIVDREARVGDNWRKRYHALTLHNQVQVNHLPYMPFPPNWPTYIPKDKLANWFETYVDAMELNFWTGTEFVGGSYDDATGRWTVELRRADGTTRKMQPRHVVMATGVSGIPNLPDIPGLKNFSGKVMHSSRYEDGESWTGKRALVIGTGNSGHDIAQDLHSSGAEVTLVQRSSTLITNIEPSAQLAYAAYNEGTLEDNDLIATSMPLVLAKRSHVLMTEQSKELDKPLLDGLARTGFKLDFGDGGTGWQFKYLTRGGGYYFNVGCSDLVASGAVALRQFADIETFVSEGARLKSGETIEADLIVLATGYRPQEELVKKLFGEAMAARVGPIWGFGDGQELRNMYTRTPQPGLWFIAGSLAQCRINSRYLALQIKAIEEGLLPRDVGPRADLS